MFVLKNGNIYLATEKQLVGVNVYSDKVVTVEGSEIQKRQPYTQVTLATAKLKFGITEDTPYTFPIEKKKRVQRKTKTEGA